jgi:hypothetical protein
VCAEGAVVAHAVDWKKSKKITEMIYDEYNLNAIFFMQSCMSRHKRVLRQNYVAVKTSKLYINRLTKFKGFANKKLHF